MKFKKDILLRYLSLAPLALAFERYLECQIFMEKSFEHPVLDLGCGDGLFAYVLFDEKIDTGIDPNSNELRRAANLGIYCELIECTGDKIPKPDSIYKTVFSNSVIEHISNLDPVFLEIHRILKPEGRFYFSVPTENFDHYTWGNRILSSFGFRHMALKYREFCNKKIWHHSHYLSPSQWKSIAEKNGFDIVESRLYDSKKICFLNNFFYPFGLLGRVNKFLVNRWIIFPRIRQVLIYPFFLIFRNLYEEEKTQDHFGLVLIVAEKGDVK